MQNHANLHQDDKLHFTEKSFRNCEKDFSDYLLGEVRDYLGFYYGSVDFDQIVGFFSMFNGDNSFSWERFESAFSKYKTTIKESEITVDELKGKPGDFLQFLYSMNMIGYKELERFGGNFIHWCFRDRSPVKLRPQVRQNVNYIVHPGLARSLLVEGGCNRKYKSQSNRILGPRES